MSTLYVDPFAVEEEKPPRDKPWGRPLLIPAKGGEREAFTRVSTMADYLCDNRGLQTWQKQRLAVGLARRPDLVAMIAALPAVWDEDTDKSLLTRQQIREDTDTKKKLNDYIEQALEAGNVHVKANFGTAGHGFTEPGADLSVVPERMRDDVDSFMTYVGSGKLEILATEVFVVNDELQCAGSFDHLGRISGVPGCSGIAVFDKKTGGVKGKGLNFAVQLSIYANSLVYDVDTDERRPLESLTGGERVSRQYGFVAHIPFGAGRTDFYKVDLMTGYYAARLAANVRKARQLDNLCTRVEI